MKKYMHQTQTELPGKYLRKSNRNHFHNQNEAVPDDKNGDIKVLHLRQSNLGEEEKTEKITTGRS